MLQVGKNLCSMPCPWTLPGMEQPLIPWINPRSPGQALPGPPHPYGIQQFWDEAELWDTNNSGCSNSWHKIQGLNLPMEDETPRNVTKIHLFSQNNFPSSELSGFWEQSLSASIRLFQAELFPVGACERSVAISARSFHLVSRAGIWEFCFPSLSPSQLLAAGRFPGFQPQLPWNLEITGPKVL